MGRVNGRYIIVWTGLRMGSMEDSRLRSWHERHGSDERLAIDLEPIPLAKYKLLKKSSAAC